MANHLRLLARCSTCGAPATEELYNAWNASQGVYCSRHARAALSEFNARHPDLTGGAGDAR